MKRVLMFCMVCTLIIIGACVIQKTNKEILPVPSHQPNKAQLEQIGRKYGMFIHFGINTFQDMEWTDGSKPASSYNPSAIDAEQWIKTAKDAGMKYVILVTKHIDGFCLWDSQYTEYDVANSGNTTNVVEAVAKACEKYDIGMGIYYALWDRKVNGNEYINGDHHPHRYVKNDQLDEVYNTYMINQLNELIDITEPHTRLVEFWLDGGWVKENYRWPLLEIYQTIKSRIPDCQVGVNWTIGLPGNPDVNTVAPQDQQAGYPIRYFPSDFRLGDPYLPGDHDPKIFTHNGKDYYMPWESTVCMSEKWFYNTTDTTYKSLDELADIYKKATLQDNILILNCPPNRDGKLRDRDINLLMELKGRIAAGS